MPAGSSVTLASTESSPLADMLVTPQRAISSSLVPVNRATLPPDPSAISSRGSRGSASWPHTG